MSRLAVIDGVQLAPEEAKVSVYDRGFLYGDSVFETVRTYGGELFALDEHLDRLEESAAKIGVVLPVDKATFAAETTAAVQAANNPETYARIMLTRGVGPVGLDPALVTESARVILVEPLTMPPSEHYEHGIGAWCVQTVRASDAAESAKLGNYLASALALRKARDAGGVEALVVNRDGLVVEGTTSNVFAVIDGVVVTPPVSIGILAGITRRFILDIAETEGISVRYEALPPDEIVRAAELFLTSSIREVLPIVSLDGRAIGSGEPGAITRRLHRAFRKKVGMDGKLPFEDGGVALGPG